LPRTSSWRWAAEVRLALAAVMAIGVPAVLGAQDTTATPPYSHAVATWIALIATPGYERLATDRILSAQPEWTRDAVGNLIRQTGSGTPRRVVACGIDESGYAVSEITDDGYLRVHGAGNERHAALWDQFHEGQRVIVVAIDRANPARPRSIPGVIAVRSNHLWRRRVNDETPVSIENLWVDIGASSRADVERMGVDVLDPVVRDWPEWTFSDYVAGPGAGNRAGCAAVAAAADAAGVAGASTGVGAGQTTFIISVQKSFGWVGLTSALARLGRVDSLYIVDAALSGRRPGVRTARAPWPAVSRVDVGAVMTIGVPGFNYGTLAEALHETDLVTLQREVALASGINGRVPPPLVLGHGWTAAPPLVVRDSLSRYADILGKLTDIYAPSGHEQPMRDAILAMVPDWARRAIVTDSAGNLVLAMGPDRDTSVIVAHMDEIGFEVTGIAKDGTVSVRPHGSFFPYLWEGQPALLHRDSDKIPGRDGKLGCGAARNGPLRGVFVPRDSAAAREPGTMTAWFGRDSAELVANGVRVGSPLTGFKCSARLGDMRLTARSIDDRAGVTALVTALEDIDPAKLDHKVIFMWSVREEGGLLGAEAAASAWGPSVHRVHAIDTFVSSDSPVESPRFAYAPLGKGAVVRALDNSDVTPPEEIDRVVKLARASGIPLQVGVTNGGNDGSEFARVGALAVAIGWPLRYSHSPAEVADLRDIRALSRMVVALATGAIRAPVRAPTHP
jgi:putative aminopeptidase FrvX